MSIWVCGLGSLDLSQDTLSHLNAKKDEMDHIYTIMTCLSVLIIYYWSYYCSCITRHESKCRNTLLDGSIRVRPEPSNLWLVILNYFLNVRFSAFKKKKTEASSHYWVATRAGFSVTKLSPIVGITRAPKSLKCDADTLYQVTMIFMKDIDISKLDPRSQR